MIKRTNEEWRALLSEQRASGQPQVEWCAAHGINLYTFRDKASRLRKMDKQKPVAPVASTATESEPTPSWIEVKKNGKTVETPEVAGQLTIEIGGIRISAWTGYPISELAVLCRELCAPC